MTSSSNKTLAETLHQLMQRAGPYTPGLLSRLSGVPKMTIVNWLNGRVARPRTWQDLLRVAAALRLNAVDVTCLLRSAGHPTLAELLDQPHAPKERALLAAWQGAAQPFPGLVGPRPAQRLPVPAFALLGRTAELRACHQLIAQGARVLTLTGPGGVGKTRLALQLAHELQHTFAHGVVWVSLALLSDPEQVVPAIAHALELAASGDSLVADIAARLRHQEVLLVLDNGEHVAARVASVLHVVLEAPGLRVLTTSRRALHIANEHELVVPPLPLPALDTSPSLAQLAASPAVELFVQRAQRALPSFVLTPVNALAVATMCARLDGLPLAIELAAARSKVVSPQELLDWFSSTAYGNALHLLIGGAVNLPPHQRTLRDTIAWSECLLPPEAQQLFRRLGVFVGGCTLHAAAAVAALAPQQATALAATAAGLRILAEHHLLQRVPMEDGTERWMLLETIRGYALEQLRLNGEEHEVRARHADYYRMFVEQAATHRAEAEQVRWAKQLEQEASNVAAALRWAEQSGELALGLQRGV
jgi:predicted ATPase